MQHLARPGVTSAEQRLGLGWASPAPLLLTAKDVEAALQLGRTRTYQLLRSGEIPVVRVGRALRVPRAGLERWLADQMEMSPPEAAGALR